MLSTEETEQLKQKKTSLRNDLPSRTLCLLHKMQVITCCANTVVSHGPCHQYVHEVVRVQPVIKLPWNPGICTMVPLLWNPHNVDNGTSKCQHLQTEVSLRLCVLAASKTCAAVSTQPSAGAMYPQNCVNTLQMLCEGCSSLLILADTPAIECDLTAYSIRRTYCSATADRKRGTSYMAQLMLHING